MWLLVLLPAAGFGGWRLLNRLADIRFARLRPFDLAFYPGRVEFGFVSVFLAAFVSVLLLWLAVRICLGSRYAEYGRYERLRWGIPPAWVVAGLGIALTAFFGLAAAALLDNYFALTADRIRINGLFSAGERAYAYPDVQSIRTAPRWIAPAGNQVDAREYVLCFRDGRAWITTWAPGVVSQPDRLRVAELVSERSEVPVTELPVLTKEHPSCR